MSSEISQFHAMLWMDPLNAAVLPPWLARLSDAALGLTGWIWIILTVLLLMLLFAAIRLGEKQRNDTNTAPQPEAPPPVSTSITLPGDIHHLRIGATQHIGKRQEQQDAFLFSEDDTDRLTAEGFQAIVADGMGGLQMGRQASHEAVQTFRDTYAAGIGEQTCYAAMRQALHTTNSAVWQLATEAQLQGNVGTTLVAITIKDGLLHWISAGDSRIYLYRDHTLSQLTEDHVYLRYLAVNVAQGQITQEEALSHPEKDALTSFIGVDEVTEIEQNETPFPLEPGDRILLSSDGLHGMLKANEIQLHLEKDPQQAVEDLVQRVHGKRNPYQDNITIVLVAYGETVDETSQSA